MRYLRLLILSLLLLFVIITAISLLIPSRVRISKAINVKAEPAAVWKQVADMNNWKNWNPFFASVSPASVQAIDTTGGKLNAMNVNNTIIRWHQIKADERIASMEREARKPVFNGWKCITHTGSDSTTVQWYMDFQLRWYPWEKFGSILFEKSYGPQMEAGLTNLKKLAETDLSSNK